MPEATPAITVGELIARFLEALEVKAAFGVISIHNMPILDAFHRRGQLRFVSARGEAGAANMADAYARVSAALGVCVTSTGTGAGNAAGALVEALTAGTPMLHLTGQIESAYVDRDLGFIHEAPAQLKMLEAVSKAAYRIRNPDTALATLIEAVRVARTPPCGPVSIEIPIDIQAATLPIPAMFLQPPGALKAATEPKTPEVSASAIAVLAERLATAKRPLLWLGGGARGAGAAVRRLVDMGFGVVTSVQGRGVIEETHPMSLGAFNLQKPAEAFYATVDAMLIVGSRLRSNETLGYALQLPAMRYRIDANALAEGRAYSSELFLQGDAQETLNALADALLGRMKVDAQFAADLRAARQAAEGVVDQGLALYVHLKNELNTVLKGECWWVRDITLSNSHWGNRSLWLKDPRAGVHALGGGIGQGLAMGIGTAIANAVHDLGRKSVALVGDGGFMLNVGELACAVQERANLLILVMNDQRYGVIRNIQDAQYGGRHCYVDLATPDFAKFCDSLSVPHWRLTEPQQTATVLSEALKVSGPALVEIDMNAWGPFAAKFAGPPKK